MCSVRGTCVLGRAGVLRETSGTSPQIAVSADEGGIWFSWHLPGFSISSQGDALVPGKREQLVNLEQMVMFTTFSLQTEDPTFEMQKTQPLNSRAQVTQSLTLSPKFSFIHHVAYSRLI